MKELFVILMTLTLLLVYLLTLRKPMLPTCSFYFYCTNNFTLYSIDICESGETYKMCPRCDEQIGCKYWYLSDSCFLAKVLFIFNFLMLSGKADNVPMEKCENLFSFQILQFLFFLDFF